MQKVYFSIEVLIASCVLALQNISLASFLTANVLFFYDFQDIG